MEQDGLRIFSVKVYESLHSNEASAKWCLNSISRYGLSSNGPRAGEM